MNMKLGNDELSDILCDYISAIDDDNILRKPWLRSFEPYNIICEGPPKCVKRRSKHVSTMLQHSGSLSCISRVQKIDILQ